LIKEYHFEIKADFSSCLYDFAVFGEDTLPVLPVLLIHLSTTQRIIIQIMFNTNVPMQQRAATIMDP
jgi:predicted RNA methylase